MTSAGSRVCDPYCIANSMPGTTGPEKRRTMIREAAYYRAERRGFAPGYELQDWLTAEREIDAEAAAGKSC